MLYYLKQNFKKAILTFLTILFISTFQKAYSQILPPTNGSPTCSGCAPAGWSVLSGSTDISNNIGWSGYSSYPWVSVVNPPNGHITWMTGYSYEAVSAPVTGLTSGASYTISFYMSEMQTTAAGTVDPLFDGILEVTIGGISYFKNFTGGASAAWSLETITFTATAASMTMVIKYKQPSPSGNGNMWNVAFGVPVITLGTDLLEFTSICTEKGNRLSWSRNSDVNNKEFAIERSENNGAWSTIGYVSRNVENNDIQQYEFLDTEAPLKPCYYRLIQEDENGDKLASEVTSANREDCLNWNIYPNPASNFTILTASEKLIIDNLFILDLKGNSVNEQVLFSIKDEKSIQIDFQRLAKGNYWLKYGDKDPIQIIRN